MGAPFETQAVTVQRRAAWIVLAMFTLNPIIINTSGLWRASLSPLILSLLGGSWLLGWFGSILAGRNAWPVVRSTRLRADSTGLELDGRKKIARAKMTSGYVVPGAIPTVRIVRRARFSLEVRLQDDAQAQRLLDALDLDVAGALATFRAAYGGARKMMASLVAWVGAMLIGPWAVGHALSFFGGPRGGLVEMLAALAYGLTVGMVLTLRSRCKAVVGADGLLISRWAGSDEFVSYGEVEAVRIEGSDVVVVRRAKPPLRLGLGLRRMEGEQDAANRNALVQRLEDARASYEAGNTGDRLAVLLAPGNRTPREWLRSIRSLSADPRYRHVDIPAEQLWRVIEDPSAEASLRAGAAAALQTLDAPGRARLADVARVSASPKLRVALEAVATPNEDEAALEDAFEGLLTER